MPSKMVAYRPKRAHKKAGRMSHNRRMRLYKNMPVSIPRSGTLLSKSQYCDFELCTLVEIKTSDGPLNPTESTRVFTRFDYG